MGEEIKLANMKTSESNSTLYRKYQELMGTVQRKEDMISRLETQLAKQVRASSACRFVSFMIWRDFVIYGSKVQLVSLLHITLNTEDLKATQMMSSVRFFLPLFKQKPSFSHSSICLFITKD